ncbi:MAG: DNA-binding protein AraC-type [Paenibacillaceae bacterium]|jgi:AraC-like DNA-binding protein|nr:DNA-binding protein AraC-type [Paenibacillaceae bacterium]
MKLSGFELPKWLQLVSNRYGIGINLHDISGVSQIDESMAEAFAPYLYHNNAFCNYLKKFEKTYNDCARNKDILCWMCNKHDSPFYGTCYMGVGEIRYPVRWNGRLIAFLCVGQFYTDLDRSLQVLGAGIDKYELDAKEASRRYLSVSKPLPAEYEEIVLQIGLLSEYISLHYGKFLSMSKNGLSMEEAAESHKCNYIVNRTLSYIHDNYQNQLTLKVLAGNCYCSEPYLSTLFKTKVGTTVIEYINSYRVAKAKELLDVTVLPITVIAFRCGFGDSNYFSRVFRRVVGLSPREYRQRKQ